MIHSLMAKVNTVMSLTSTFEPTMEMLPSRYPAISAGQ